MKTERTQACDTEKTNFYVDSLLFAFKGEPFGMCFKRAKGFHPKNLAGFLATENRELEFAMGALLFIYYVIIG